MSTEAINQYIRLYRIQKELLAKKDKAGKGVSYTYRTVEGILSHVKPLLEEGEVIIMNDEVVMFGDEKFLKATAKFLTVRGEIISIGYASLNQRPTKSGSFTMTAAQWTGACSTYARKTALCGLLAIDDGQDIDGKDYSKEIAEKSKYINADQLGKVNEYFDSGKVDKNNIDVIYKQFGITELNKIPGDRVNDVFSWLEAWENTPKIDESSIISALNQSVSIEDLKAKGGRITEGQKTEAVRAAFNKKMESFQNV